MGLCAPVRAGICVFKSTSSETRLEPQPLIARWQRKGGFQPLVQLVWSSEVLPPVLKITPNLRELQTHCSS